MKHRHLRRILTGACSATLLLALLAGCGNQGKQGSQTPEKSGNTAKASAEPSGDTATPSKADTAEKVNISVSFWDIDRAFPQKHEGSNDIRDYIYNKFNIEITPVNVTWGDAEEKYTTWGASGQLPDIIGAADYVGSSRYYEWIDNEVIRALPDNLDAYPTVKERLNSPDVTAYDYEGKHWFFPRYTYPEVKYWSMDRGMMLRKDWLEKLNLKMPETEQEYIDTLVAFATKDPDGNGKNDTVGYLPAAGFAYTSQGWPGFGVVDNRWRLNSEGKVVMNCAEKEAMMPQMSFLRKLFKAGGMDPDFLTMTNEETQEKFASGRVGLYARQIAPAHFNRLHQKWAALQPNVDFVDAIEFVPGPSPTGKYTRFEEKVYWSESYFNSNVDDTKMDRILQLYNWLCSEEGMRMMSFGIEGKQYKMNNGKVEITREKNPETGLYYNLLDYEPFSGLASLATWTGDNIQYENPAIEPRLVEKCKAELDKRSTQWESSKIDWRLNAINVPEKEEISAIKFSDDWGNFIMNTSDASDDELYEAMRKNWDANGYSRAVEAITAAAKEQGLLPG